MVNHGYMIVSGEAQGLISAEAAGREWQKTKYLDPHVCAGAIISEWPNLPELLKANLHIQTVLQEFE